MYFKNEIKPLALGIMLGFGLLAETIGHRGIFFVCAALSAVTLTIFLLYRHRVAATTATVATAA